MGIHLLDIRRWTIDCSCGWAYISGHTTLNYWLFMWMGIHLWTYDVELLTVHVDGHTSLDISVELLTVQMDGWASAGHTTLNCLLFIWLDIHLPDIRCWAIDCSSGWTYICWTYDVELLTVHVDEHTSAGHTTLNYWLFMWMGMHLLDIRRWFLYCSCGRAYICWTYDVELLTVHVDGHASAGHKTLNYLLFMWTGIHLLDIRRWTIDCSCGWACICWTYDVDFFTVHVDGHTSAGHTTLNYWLFMWTGIHLLDIRLWTIYCSCGRAYICWTYDVELLTVHVDGHASAGHKRWTIDCSYGRANICWIYDVQLFTVHVDGHTSAGHTTLNYWLFMWTGIHLL